MRFNVVWLVLPILASVYVYRLWNSCTIQPCVRYRFDSFAPVHNDSKVKWFVDGQDYMSAVADAIEAAEKEILITDFQMSPYIFMKRSDNGANNLKWRLDKMLTRKAGKDVRVYILLYWETQLTPGLDLGSNHTLSILNEHPNIAVYRHPDSISAIQYLGSKLLWSHHEKLVIVDRSIAFVGGIDLCFGRWDTHAHELMDDYPLHPCAKQHCEGMEADKRYSRWVGKDYKNTFFSNDSKTDWERPYDDYEYVNRSKIPRMPWHDVACAFTGAAVSDAVKHFIQRYNALNPSWWKFSELHHLPTELKLSESKSLDVSSYAKANIQVLRSVDYWSAGQTPEASIYNAYLHAIENAKKYIYIENQFFVSSIPGVLVNVQNQIQSALADRIYRAYKKSEDFHVMIVLPLKPEFSDEWNPTNLVNSLTGVSYWNYATLFSGNHSLAHRLKRELKMPAKDVSRYLSVYGLRTHSLLGEGLATEIIYVHSKLMIVDDQVSIIGSANINDRSMLGGRDSEVAVIVEDVEMINGKMNNRLWQVGMFSHTLRCHLHKEHLGLLNTENEIDDFNVKDPLLESFIKGISKQANDNMITYERVFRSRILPTNHVWKYDDLRNWKNIPGLVDIDQNQAKEELQKVRGNIVTFPRLFLKDELKLSIVDIFAVFTDSRGMTREILDNDQPVYHF